MVVPASKSECLSQNTDEAKILPDICSKYICTHIHTLIHTQHIDRETDIKTKIYVYSEKWMYSIYIYTYIYI